jgi:hypothetical protein
MIKSIDEQTAVTMRLGTPELIAERDKHTRQIALLEEEDRKLQVIFCDKMLRDFAPQGELELQIAWSIAQDTWTCLRYRAIQENYYQLKLDTFLQFVLNLDQRIHINTAQLTKMQTARRAERDKYLDKAALLAQLNLSQGHTYNPDYDFAPGSGFTFTMYEIEARINRNKRLREAKALEQVLAREARKALRT